METALYIAIAIVGVVLIISVLLQEKGSDVGSAFGGGGATTFRTRRGLEKLLFQISIVTGTAFVLLALIRTLFF